MECRTAHFHWWIRRKWTYSRLKIWLGTGWCNAEEANPFRYSKHWSLCPAYTIDGYITWEIVHGSFSAELFEDFIENKVLPLCNPYPLPQSVIIMDNAPIHQIDICWSAMMSLIIRYCSDFVIMLASSSHSYRYIHWISTLSRSHLQKWKHGWGRIIHYRRTMKRLKDSLSLLCDIWLQKPEITFDHIISQSNSHIIRNNLNYSHIVV